MASKYDPDKAPDPDFKPPSLESLTTTNISPDYMTPVEGWRAWRVSGEVPRFGVSPKLFSANHGNYYWVPRKESIAECGKCGEDIPGESCSCGFYCLPLDTEILTQRGWLRYDQVVVGDSTLGLNPITRQTEWTQVTDIVVNGSQEVFRVGNDYWSARASGNHRWPVWAGDRQYFLTTLELSGERRLPDGVNRYGSRPEIVSRAPFVGGDSALTPTEAAIIAWLHTDGSTDQGRIFQEKKIGVGVIERLLRNTPHTVGTTPTGFEPGDDRYTFRLRTPYFRALWHKAMEGRSLLELVLSLSPSALDAFMEAAFIAEGHTDGTGRRMKVYTQNAGPVCDALALGAYLQGYRPRVHVHDSETSFSPRRGICRRIRLCTSAIRGANLEVEKLGYEPTWCVTTGLGSWTARQGEQIILTGNSAKSLEHLMTMPYPRYDGERRGHYCVIGIVANWGKVIEGSLGWRAQKSYPVKLFVPFEIWKLAKPLEEGYGVPVELMNFLKPGKAVG